MRKLLAMSMAVLLALTISACGGDDDDDDTGSDDTEESTDEGGEESGDASQRDKFRDGLLAQGRSEENADCIMDAIESQFSEYGEDELYAPEGAPDDVTAAVPDIAAQCDEEVPSE